MDSAFFSDEIVMAMEEANIEFTVSVPFERFVELKGKIERCRRWKRLNGTMSCFEESWKPHSWKRRFRFLFIRTLAKRQRKEPIQLDLFVPHEYGYDFKVVVTNKTLSPKKVVAFHEGRGSQEGIFGELKTDCQMGYVPVRKCLGNQMYLLAGLFAHNLLREFQMMTSTPSRHTTEKRTPLHGQIVVPAVAMPPIKPIGTANTRARFAESMNASGIICGTAMIVPNGAIPGSSPSANGGVAGGGVPGRWYRRRSGPCRRPATADERPAACPPPR